MAAPPPPSKKDHLNKLLERGSVFIHLDPRREGVAVPAWLAKKPQLVLQLGLNFPIPIRDLEIDDEGVRCTLSFNRAPFYCVLPWSAVYALVAEDGEVTVWPSEIPSELIPRAESAVRRDGPRDRREKPGPRRPRISVVPPPPEGAVETASTTATAADASTPGAADATAREAESAAAVLDAVSERPSSPRAADEADGDDASVSADGATASPRAPAVPATGGRKPRERPPYLRLVK